MYGRISVYWSRFFLFIFRSSPPGLPTRSPTRLVNEFCPLFAMPVSSLFIMYGRRIYRRRSFARRRGYGISRYVTDTIAFNRPLPADSTEKVCVIAPTVTAGVRKVRGFRLELTCANPCMFALIYFPEGISTDTAQLVKSTALLPTSIYTPEQHIITSGILRDSSLTIARSRRGRSLANGDSIYLLARLFENADDIQLYAKITFAVAFG
jgi:hypothetical protein